MLALVASRMVPPNQWIGGGGGGGGTSPERLGLILDGEFLRVLVTVFVESIL